MTAENFLDAEKQRYFRVMFPDFFIDSDNPFLLGVTLHEVMSDNPDIEIGNLVIPELTLQTVNTDMKDFLDCEISAESGIEQNRQEVTDEITAIQEYFSQAENLLIMRTATGIWLAVTGKQVYSVRMIQHQPDVVHTYRFDSMQEITGIWLEENSVQIDSQNQIRSSIGKAFFLHAQPPYLGYTVFQTVGLDTERPYLHFDSEEYQIPITEAVYQEILQNGSLNGTDSIGYCHLGYSEPFSRHVEKLYLKTIRYYDENRQLRQKMISGMLLDFEVKSYGEFILKEASTQDEEVLTVCCYGILDRLSNLNAENFFRTAFHSRPATLAEVYQSFIEFLNQNAISVQAGNQEFLTLDSLPAVEPDWSTADFSGLTAAQILKEFAILEGGNAYISHDNLLLLGWNSTEPVLTCSAENTASLRIGNEKLAPAQGIELLYQDCRNLIQTALHPEDMVLPEMTNPENFSEACSAVIHHFDTVLSLPFSVSVLTGASPAVRAGDCIRILTRNRCALKLPVTEQEITAFPFLQSRISHPDGTSWDTIPVDFEYLSINGLRAENWPAFMIFGSPDFSQVIVTALARNGDNFQVENQLCEFEIEMRTPEYAEITVHFCGLQTKHLSTVRYALYTDGGQMLLTNQPAILAVKEST